MRAIPKSEGISALHIVWRNPCHRSEDTGLRAALFVVKDYRFASKWWLQSPIRFCEWYSICKGLLNGKPDS
jgi:hypothetical protein